jgi:hypothetical protein
VKATDLQFDDNLSGAQRERTQMLLAELARRRKSPHATYEPQPQQDACHASRATYRLVAGGWRSGKSTTGYTEDARAALGCDPYDKYPKPTVDYKLRIWIIVFDEKQIGRTVYRSLFEPGLFFIIRDLKTGMWRTFHPDEDAARTDQKLPAPPLIPPEMIAEWGWDNRAQRIFNVCRLTNGTEIYAFTSGAEPPTGDPVDLVHIDEDIKNAAYIPELQARLSDRKGRFIWTCRPRMKNDALVKMHKRAEEERALPVAERDVEEFRLSFSGNPYIDGGEKKKRLRDWKSDQERRNYDQGEFVFDDVLMYPDFSPETHGVPAVASVPDRFELSLRSGVVPADWTRYLYIDPGYGIMAGLFLAVPPPEPFGDYVLAYDELYVQQAHVEDFSDQAAKKMEGQAFYAFVIDDHGSRTHNAQSRVTLREQLAGEFKRRRISSETTGHNFILGCDDVEGRCSIVRSWLRIRECGTPKFRVLVNRCPNLVREFTGYYRKIVDGVITDRPRSTKFHLMDCLGYGAAHNPKYFRVSLPEKQWSPAYAAFMRDKKRAQEQGGDRIYLGPGTPPAHSPALLYS